MASFRAAKPEDAAGLRDLERAASLPALAHVFPPSRYPYPDGEVFHRWQLTLADKAVGVLVVDDSPGLACLVACDSEVIRHLAVHPACWGEGLAAAAMTHVVDRSPVRHLWCLEANHRARGFYRHLGWEPSGATRAAEWPPYPIEIELVLPRP